jgi:hypothetical protein
MSKVEDKLVRIIREKATVITRAIFWKIRHNSNQRDIRLKLGRYKKPKDYADRNLPETLEPKSELTLDEIELNALVKLLQENYEPFRQGVKAFIPLNRPYDPENANQIKALFSLPDKKRLVEFILANKIISRDLEIGLQQARRIEAVREFTNMLLQNKVESDWQGWFKNNDWVLGSDFVRVIDERQIDVKNISDFLMQAYDGFLDIVEIKRPEGDLRFWAASLDHGNSVPSADLTKAITQASHYIFEVEREANSVKFLERVGHVKTVKPRCVLIFGRSDNWNDEQIEAYRILNASFHNLTIMTYDHVLQRAKRIVGLNS